MEFRVTSWPHVRNVNVTAAAVCFFVNDSSVLLNPLAIACRNFAVQRYNCDATDVRAISVCDRNLDWNSILIHQTGTRDNGGAQWLTRYREKPVTGMDIDARSVQR